MKNIISGLHAKSPAHARRNRSIVFLLMAPFVLIGVSTKLLNLPHALTWIALVPFVCGAALVCYQFWADGQDLRQAIAEEAAGTEES